MSSRKRPAATAFFKSRLVAPMMRTSAWRGGGTPKRPYCVSLQHAQQLALHFHGHLSDFIQEQGSAISGFKPAGPVLDGSGESAFDVTEELAFEQFPWNRSAVDPHEGTVFAAAAAMNLARYQIFAGPGFAEDEDRGFGGRDQVDLADDLPQGGALADEVAEGFGFHHLLLQVGILQFELGFEPLDVLEGARVGDGGPNMVREDSAPRAGFQRHILASERDDNA